MKTTASFKSTLTSTNPSQSQERNTNNAPTKHHSTRVNPPSKTGKGRSKKFYPNDWNRPEIKRLLDMLEGHLPANLPNSPTELIAFLVELAMRICPDQLIYKFGFKEFLSHFLKNHDIFSLDPLTFNQAGLVSGCHNKKAFLSSIVDCIRKASWMDKYDPKIGGLVMYVTKAVKMATTRDKVTVSTGRSIAGFTEYRITPLACQRRCTPFDEFHFFSEPEPIEEDRIEFAADAHHRQVAFFRRWVENYKTWTAPARRKWKGKLLKVLHFHGIEPSEVDFPLTKLPNKKRVPTASASQKKHSRKSGTESSKVVQFPDVQFPAAA